MPDPSWIQLDPDEARRAIVTGEPPDALRVAGDLDLACPEGLWPTKLRLPAALSVDGDLDLSGLVRLTSLPSRLEVAGSLRARSCKSIRCLPDRLMVERNLSLIGCTALETLSGVVSVTGTLAIDACAALRRLPNGLRVTGDLTASGCTSLESLPRNLSVGRDLTLNTCAALKELPAGLSVGRNLDLLGCGVRELPTDLAVGGDLSLSSAALQGVSVDQSIQGSVSFFGMCEDETPHLPEDWVVPGDLDLSLCKALIGLPRGLTVGGRLLLGNCERLRTLPADLSVGSRVRYRADQGDPPESDAIKAGRGLARMLATSANGIIKDPTDWLLDLILCTSLEGLPLSLRELPGPTRLAYCTRIRRLPAGLRVAGSLNLCHCTGLTELPDGMLVEGHLELTGCTGLTGLPPGLRVQGGLGVSSPFERPPGLSVGWVVLDGVRVPEHVVWSPGEITSTEIENESNVEVRRVMIETYGLGRFVRDMRAVEIDRYDEEGETASNPGLRGAVLYRKEIDGEEPWVVVRLVDASPGPDGRHREYFLRVPPALETCRAAVAWTFGLEPGQYAPSKET